MISSRTRFFEELHPPLAHSFHLPPTPTPLHQLRPRITRTSLTTVFYDSACSSNTPSRLTQQTSTHSSPPQSRKSKSCRIGLEGPLFSSLKRGRFALSADLQSGVESTATNLSVVLNPFGHFKRLLSRRRCKLRRRISGTTGEVEQIHRSAGFREGWVTEWCTVDAHR